MLQRKAMADIRLWKDTKPRQGLLVTGARQVGKTTLIREFAKLNYDVVVEINFFERPDAVALISEASSTEDLILRITALADKQLVPGKSLVFFDEIQEFADILTWTKFLQEQTSYDYVFSGSLLGIDTFNVRSWPVGFLSVLEMFPLDFEEFCWANSVADDIIGHVREAFHERRPVDGFIHNKLIDLYRKYLLAGGMPSAVQSYCDSFDLQAVRGIQADIMRLYQLDISKYIESKADARFVKTLYDAIPGQLNKENKRFIFKDVAPKSSARFSHLETSFDWLEFSGVALPAYRVSEPSFPLALSGRRSAFKLYLNDIGLLTASIMGTVSTDILQGRTDINYGSLYENAVAQELRAQGYALHYYNTAKYGEVDFVIEDKGEGAVSLIEVKSGKDYRRHVALDNLLSVPGYSFRDVLVLSNGNVEVQGPVTYLPVYMAGLLGER